MNFSDFLLDKNSMNKTKGRTLALGAFDGCHLGHRVLFDKVDFSVTFHPSPKAYFSPNDSILNLIDEKKILYPGFVFLKFDERMIDLSGEQFIKGIVDTLAPKKIVVGWDFHFGRNLQGNTDAMKSLAEKYKFKLEIVPPVKVDGHIVKSTLIRELLHKGEIEKANCFLGYEYFFMSEVVHGKGLGKKLGFPTINLKIVPRKLLPKSGVYSGHTAFNGRKHLTAISILRRETLECEGHILDFKEDLYGQTVQISFNRFVREQQNFSTTELLKKQIELDVKEIATNR
ncbi:MAG: riboflavin biosynthesis protein RibF [Candidatus Margulisbacteria bacterium]|nr:riboflavin biosynthesis protein RibF [Candidatus Margulisiibacteriota bacterium]